jgi:SAM-dependent methyltransferase
MDDRWLAGSAYERYMGRWSRPLADAFLEWLGAPRGSHWLEIGCGTGALTSAIARSCDPQSVMACDPAEPFLEHARQHTVDPRVAFVVAGADEPPAREGGFDAAVSGLVLNFLPAPAAVLATLRDRLRPGGLVGGYVWDYAEGMEFLRVFWDEATAIDPRAAALDEGRRFPLCSGGALRRLFEGAGLTDVDTGGLQVETPFAGFDDFWDPFLRGTGPAPAFVASLEPAARDHLAERLRRRLQPSGGGEIRLRARAWCVRALSATPGAGND